MKKILFLTELPVIPLNGGVEQLTQNLSKSLIDNGYEVICLALHRERHSEDTIYIAPQYFFPNTDIFSEENVIFYNDFIVQNKINVIINQIGNTPSSYLFLDIDEKIRQNVKIITVCNNKPLANYNRNYRYKLLPLMIEKKKIFIIKCIIKILFYPAWRFLWYPRKEITYYKKLYTFDLKKSDILVVNSSKYISEIQTIIPGDRFINKFVVIPNPNTYSINSTIDIVKEKQVLYVGRLEPNQKRPDLLLKVWKKIHKNHSDWELIILGSGIMENKMRSYVKKNQLGNVCFKGTVDPLPYYKSASIITLTSIYEGFPMVLTEAMAHGVAPVLFDSFGAAGDVVIHNKTGFLITPFNLNEFASKLSCLMKNEELRRGLSENAKDHVKKYDIKNIMKDWKQIIEL